MHFYAVLRIKLDASHMLGKRCTTELQRQSPVLILFNLEDQESIIPTWNQYKKLRAVGCHAVVELLSSQVQGPEFHPKISYMFWY